MNTMPPPPPPPTKPTPGQNSIALTRVKQSSNSYSDLFSEDKKNNTKSVAVLSLTRCELKLFPKFSDEHEYISPGHAHNATRCQVERTTNAASMSRNFCTAIIANSGSVFKRNVKFANETAALGKTNASIPRDDDEEENEENEEEEENGKKKRKRTTTTDDRKHRKHETEMIEAFEGQEFEIMCLKIREVGEAGGQTEEQRVATVDATGRLTVCKVPKTKVADDDDDKEKAELLYKATPKMYKECETFETLGSPGWAGLSFCPLEENNIAVCKLWTRTIDWFEQDRVVRTNNLLESPTSIAHMETPHSGRSVLCIGENNEVVVYDHRVDKKNGEVGRVKQVASDNARHQIQALEPAKFSGNSVLCCAGKERTVSVVDPRKWTARYRWKNCAKYEVTGLYAPRTIEGFVCVASLDYEILCGSYEKGKLGGGFTFRNDARVVGIGGAKFGDKSDVVCTWTDTGKLTAAKISVASSVSIEEDLKVK